MKKVLLLGIYFLSIAYAPYCNAQGSSITAIVTDRAGKSQVVNDIRFRFIRNNWLNVRPQNLNYFYVRLRYSFNESEYLFYSLNEIKEINFKEKFNTGVIIRKRDGSYIDLKMNLNVLPHEISISFYDTEGRLINSKELYGYDFKPSEKPESGWCIHECIGSISLSNKKKEKYFIEIPHDVRKIVFH